ncbi:MAG: 16S rRNA (cytosine(967)-C(5))-methyltransferase RsmB [Clostridiales bacterium]|nr:16S rRNA (cytosine(967)-C(5))-methyltransferase RsmB [Clostridiales bacterium]
MKSPRQLAYETLLKIEKDKAYSNLVLDSLLSDANGNVRDSAFVSAVVYGVTERLVTLDYTLALYLKEPLSKLKPQVLTVLRMGAYQILYMDRVPDSAAVNESVVLAKINCRYASSLVNAVLRSVVRNGLKLPEEDGLKRISLEYSCPEWLADMLIQSYGEDAARKMLASFIGKPRTFIRVNTLKTDVASLAGELEAEGIKTLECEIVPEALEVLDAAGLNKTRAYAKGLFHVEDISSQLCCGALAAQPGETVMDMCASPGGKSFTIAQMMENRGALYSFDKTENRVSLIKNGSERLGIHIINAGVNDACVHNSGLPAADRVLCDVPCSGFGVMGRKPEIKYKSKDELDNLPSIQYCILRTCSEYVKPGGRLVYSTCTLCERENREVCEKFLSENAGFVPERVLPDIPRRDNTDFITLLPGISGSDGFFIAAFKRLTEEEN